MLFEVRKLLPDSLLALAAEQCGVLSRAQLRGCGLSEHVITANRRAGRWAIVHPGVYAVHTGPIAPMGRIWAGVLYAGAGATASHVTAAQLWGLVTEGPEHRVHLLVPATRTVIDRPDVLIRRCHHLAARTHPVARPPRTRIEDTILDLAADAERYAEIVDWVTLACQSRRTTPRRLRDCLGRRARQRWRVELQALLADVSDGAQTPLELAYLRTVERAHGLPCGRRQRHRWVGAESQWIDVQYERFQLIVELDGRLGHELHRDHRRDNASTVLGYASLRYGWVAVTTTPCAVAAEVAATLTRHGWRGQPQACGPLCTVAVAA